MIVGFDLFLCLEQPRDLSLKLYFSKLFLKGFLFLVLSHSPSQLSYAIPHSPSQFIFL